jgi:hypothetical protein
VSDERIIWQNAVQIYFLHGIHSELVKLNRKVTNLATAEQVAALTSAIDELEAATETEIGQINAKIDELVAAAGDTPDPNLDAQIARLQAQRDRIAGIIADAPPKPAAPE